MEHSLKKNKPDEDSAKTNQRKFGKVTATFLTAAMIVGTGLFSSLGGAAEKAGSGILLAMLIGGVIALLTGLSASQAGVNYPEEGGAFIWTRNFGYKTISFIAGCSYLFDGITGLAILALGFATYTQQMFSWLPIPISACIALMAVGLINFLGIIPTAKVLIGIFFINLVLLGIYVGFSFAKINMANLNNLLGENLGGVLSGAAVYMWSWDGFQRTAIMADQMKDPKQTIPFAVVGGISIAATIYLIVAGTTLGILGKDKMSQTDAPVFVGASTAIASFGAWLILISAWMTSFSEMLGDLLPASKVAHAMGKEKELPDWLSKLNKRFESPQNSLLILTIIGIILVLFFPIRKLMPLASAFTIIWYIATHFSALRLPKEKRILPIFLSWLGLIACLSLFASLPIWSIVSAIAVLSFLVCTRWIINKNIRA